MTQCIGHSDRVTALHSEGRQFVTGADDKKIIFWKLGRKRKGFIFEGHANTISGVLLFS